MEKKEKRYFVMVGERNLKGQFKRMKKFKLDDFVMQVYPDLPRKDFPEIRWYDKLLVTQRYKDYLKVVKHYELKWYQEKVLRELLKNKVESIITSKELKQ